MIKNAFSRAENEYFAPRDPLCTMQVRVPVRKAAGGGKGDGARVCQIPRRKAHPLRGGGKDRPAGRGPGQPAGIFQGLRAPDGMPPGAATPSRADSGRPRDSPESGTLANYRACISAPLPNLTQSRPARAPRIPPPVTVMTCRWRARKARPAPHPVMCRPGLRPGFDL